MKLLKGRYDLTFVVYIPVLIITLASYLLASAYILQLKQLNALFFFVVLFICCTHIGSLRFSDESQAKLPWHKAFGKLLLWQLLIIGLFLNFLPLFPNASAKLSIIQASISDGLFFPWTLYGLLSVSYLYIHSHCKKQTLISDALQSILGKYAKDDAGMCFDYYLRQAIFMCIALTIGIGAWDLITTINIALKLPISFAPTMPNILLTTTLVTLLATKMCFRVIRTLSYKQVSLGVPLIGLVILFMGSVFITGYLSQLWQTHFPNIAIIPMFDIPSFIPNTNIDAYITWLWFIVWGVISTRMVSEIFQGHSVRTILLSRLILPMAYFLFEFSPVHLNALLPNWFITAWSILAYLILLWMLSKKNGLGNFVMAANVTDMHTPQNSPFVLKALLTSTLLVSVLYLIDGYVIVNIVAFIVAIPCFIIFLLLCPALIKSLWHENRQRNTSIEQH